MNGPAVRILQCYFQDFGPEIGDVRVCTGFDKGEMPSFGKKLQEPEKEALVAFLRSLK